jgi:hypothetical protein
LGAAAGRVGRTARLALRERDIDGLVDALLSRATSRERGT